MTALMEAPTLRFYQREAVDAFFDHVRNHDGDALIVLPTGSGKSLTMATIIAEARANYPALRVAILAAQAELVQQNVKAAALLNDRRDIGVYSAGLNQKDANRPITVASIQSISRVAYGTEPFDLLLCDECHQISDGDAGMYRKFFAAQKQQNPNVKIVGLTATPYKLSSGSLVGGANALFSRICYSADIVRLIEEGYLTKPVSPKTRYSLDTSGVRMAGGEFVAKALADAVDIEAVTEQAVDEVVRLCSDRKHWLIFGVSVEHCKHIAEALERRGISSAVVHGELPKDERAHRLHEFTTGAVRACISVTILTTGFDFIGLDCVVLMRPTQSAGLYAQMVGRGMRIAPGKTDCLIVDLGGNIERHGSIDAIVVRDKTKRGDGEAPVKVCPGCELYMATGVRVCVGCGHEFPPPAIVINTTASTAAILSTDQPKEWVAITSVQYNRNEAKPPKTIPTLRVDYYAGYRKVASEWVCVEHEGFARSKAEQWWARRSADRFVPSTVDEALALADELAKPLEIAIGPDPANPKYTRIADYRFTEKPQSSGLPRACWSCGQWSTISETCQKWSAPPPADVQAIGCDDWTDDETLPF